MHERLQGFGIAGEGNDSIDVSIQRGFESGGLAVIELGIGAVLNLHVFKVERLLLVLNAVSHLIPKGGCTLQSIHGDPEGTLGR